MGRPMIGRPRIKPPNICAVCDTRYSHHHNHNRVCCSDICRRLYDAQRTVVKKVLSVPDAAYIAGILDGEGTISLYKELRPGNTRGWRIKSGVMVSNTSKRLLEWIANAAGNGKIAVSCDTPAVARTRRRVCYKWWLYAHQARWFLPQVLPYLVLKKRQAEILLRYFEIVDVNRRVGPFTEELEALYNEIHALNARGVESDKSEYTLRTTL